MIPAQKGEIIMCKLKNSLIAFAGLLFLIGVVALIAPTTSHGQGKVQQLPVSSFLVAQPATQTQLWFDPATLNAVRFDAFGTRNAALGLNLGTNIDGHMTVSNLGGGTERVTVVLNTRNGLCWGFVLTTPAVPAFGRSPAEVQAGAQASLGDGITQVAFTKPEGSPSPTWNQIITSTPPYVLESVTSAIMCQDGELRLGSGFPDGTPGFAQTTQTGIYNTGVPGGCPQEHDADCYPAEKVQFRATGP
jgi:hypothetical protein